MSKPKQTPEPEPIATKSLPSTITSDITIKHLQRCVQILWEDWSNCRDMHHELDTHVAHHEALQALEIAMNIVRKIQEEEDEANLENV